MSGEIHTIYDDYDFISIIGAGSFGKVHKARSKADGRIFAVKEMNYGRLSTKEKELLVSEVNLLRKLDHPNIVKYISRYQDRQNTLIYIVMDYCASGDLARYVKQKKTQAKYIDEERVWSIFIQLLLALDYCHNPMKHNASNVGKVIHRDLKTANIFLCEDGTIKLGDFGLCRTLGDDSMARTNVGTPLYMAPELLNKQPYTEKADIWGMGCIVYELCALQPPYVATTLESLKLKVNRGVRPFIPSHFSSELRKIVDLMLQKEPDRRPTTGELLRMPAIARIVEGMGMNAAYAAQVPHAPQPPHPHAMVEQVAPMPQPDRFGRPVSAVQGLPRPSAMHRSPQEAADSEDLQKKYHEREEYLRNWERSLQEREAALKQKYGY